jgi:hypothetical protein
MHSGVNEMRGAVEVLFRAVEGNGQPGLKQKVAKLEQAHADCQRIRSQEVGKDSNKLAMAAILVAVFISPFVGILSQVALKKMGY